MYYLSLCYNIIKSTSAWKRLMGRAKARSKKDSSGTNLSNVLSFNCFLEMRSLNFVGWHPIIYIHWRVQWWELAMNYTRSVGSMTNFHIVRFHECAYVFKQCFISFWCLFFESSINNFSLLHCKILRSLNSPCRHSSDHDEIWSWSVPWNWSWMNACLHGTWLFSCMIKLCCGIIQDPIKPSIDFTVTIQKHVFCRKNIYNTCWIRNRFSVAW